MSTHCTALHVGVHPLTGEPVVDWHLQNDEVRLVISNYGLRLKSLIYCDQDASPLNLVLGLDSFEAYQQDESYLGAVVGRFANRIRNASLRLNDQHVDLDRNDGRHHLHGGAHGFSQRVWKGEATNNGIEFQLCSAAGDQGYPGTLQVTVTVSLIGSALGYHYQATSDVDTVINLTNHTYFNLNGTSGWQAGSENIFGHALSVRADSYLPIDAETLPTGEIEPVEGTPFDFRKTKVLGQCMDAGHEQLRLGQGFDHCLVLDSTSEPTIEAPAVTLYSAQSGIRLDIMTTEPGLQLYTGNYLSAPHAGLCLETQHFPDSPNVAYFPSTRLAGGDVFDSTTIYQLSCDIRQVDDT
jgi:aldose 1-epimerase